MPKRMDEEKNIIKQMNIASQCVSLLQKKDEIKSSKQFEQILCEMKDAEFLINTANNILEKNIDGLTKEYNEIMEEMRNQQSDMIKYILKIKREKIAKEKLLLSPFEQGNRAMRLFVNNSASKPILNSALKKTPQNFNLTPKNYMNDYRPSPSVHRVKFNLVPLELIEFQANITEKEFNAIPKYMKGRTHLDDLQHFLDHYVISCFTEKYNLLQRPRTTVQSTKDFDLWKLYHSQISYAPGSSFITDGDISRKLGKLIDKKMQNYIVMLRHLCILKEQRASSTVCYIWKAST